MSVHFIGTLLPSETRLPLYSFRVPCGFPSPAADHLEAVISLDDLLEVRAPQTYIVRTEGESMVGAGIFPGDLVVVDRSKDAVTGDIVVAALNGEPIIKRLGQVSGQLALLSENRRFPPLLVGEGDEFEVWGVVRGSLRLHGNG